MTEHFEALYRLFLHFPGIGRRQAERFVYHLLQQGEREREDLARAITRLGSSLRQCERCYRFFPTLRGSNICDLCADTTRDPSLLMVVEKDVDLSAVRNSGAYTGHYFVLGGTIPFLDEQPDKRIRIAALEKTLPERVAAGLTELILALSATKEGDHTVDYLRARLAPLMGTKLRITTLGRGLSTGTELEYSDSDTIIQALKHRE